MLNMGPRHSLIIDEQSLKKQRTPLLIISILLLLGGNFLPVQPLRLRRRAEYGHGHFLAAEWVRSDFRHDS
jgi:hypothetical protein